MNEEIKKLVHKIAVFVTEARGISEELENMAREDGVEDDYLEAEAYDWANELEMVEARIDDLITIYFSD